MSVSAHAALMLNKTRALLLLFPLLLVAACQTPPSGESAVLAGRPSMEAKASEGAQRYVVDPQGSEVRFLVYRDGPLARFGHNHVIVGRVQGEIRAAESAAASGFRLEIPVESFAVDPPEARAEEGEEFSAQVSGPARRDTRENMLGGEVLDAPRHPLIRIESLALVGPDWGPTVTARVTLRGAMRDLRFPAAVVRRDDAIEVIASFRINQSEFGIEPFSALNGGLRVRDAIEIRVRVVARRAS